MMHKNSYNINILCMLFYIKYLFFFLIFQIDTTRPFLMNTENAQRTIAFIDQYVNNICPQTTEVNK